MAILPHLLSLDVSKLGQGSGATERGLNLGADFSQDLSVSFNNSKKIKIKK